MHTPRHLIRFTVAATAAILTLSGCTSSAPEPTGGTTGGTASQFVACLTTAGVSAKIGDQGHVLVQLPGNNNGELTQSSGSGSGEDALLMVGDSDGTSWVAAASSAYFADDPDTQDAYAGCEAEFADFEQPELDAQNDPDIQEYLAQQEEDGLEFARCARDAGFTWVSDPNPETGGGIELPADLTEAEFRDLLEACFTPELSLAWMVPADEFDFDWQAVLEEFVGGAPVGGSSITSGGDE